MHAAPGRPPYPYRRDAHGTAVIEVVETCTRCGDRPPGMVDTHLCRDCARFLWEQMTGRRWGVRRSGRG